MENDVSHAKAELPRPVPKLPGAFASPTAPYKQPIHASHRGLACRAGNFRPVNHALQPVQFPDISWEGYTTWDRSTAFGANCLGDHGEDNRFSLREKHLESAPALGVWETVRGLLRH